MALVAVLCQKWSNMPLEVLESPRLLRRGEGEQESRSDKQNSDSGSAHADDQ